MRRIARNRQTWRKAEETQGRGRKADFSPGRHGFSLLRKQARQVRCSTGIRRQAGFVTLTEERRNGRRPRRELWERMARTDFRTPRLCVAEDLATGAEVRLEPQQTNYLVNVLRLGAGAPVLLFNGRDGEFSSSLAASTRKAASLAVGAQTRSQEAPPDVDYLFAPLKHARLDYMAQKAIEMGARTLRPVITRHTQVARVNLERLRANAIEACEQCGVIWIPEIAPVEPLGEALKNWPPERLLVFCDEEADQASPLDALGAARADGGVSLLVGPEGGFDDAERAAILSAPRVVRLSLGPRILRADTAAVAALTLIQATLGDWTKRRAGGGL
jgi:16S rRNA (uracil1498-N3)-methyltransferase